MLKTKSHHTNKLSPWVSPKVRPAVKTHGGKWYLARNIINHFPRPMGRFIETHGGGANVTNNLAHHMYCEAFLNEKNPAIFTVHLMVKHQAEKLQDSLRDIPYCEESFLKWKDCDPANLDMLQLAVKSIVVSRMSRGGLGESFAKSNRLRGGQMGDKNAWDNALADLPRLSQQLQKVQLLQRDGTELIREMGSDFNTLFYCDPPYLPEVRTAKRAYNEFEMTPEEHVSLLEALQAVKAKAIISHYRCDMYDTALAGWRRVEFEIANHSGQGQTKNRRIETIWLNF